MSSPALHRTCVYLVLVFFISASVSLVTSSSITNDDLIRLSPTADTPKLQAERLIRSLNLFPNVSVNVRVGEEGFVPGKIVEKKFSLFGSNGPSVEDLGHHAGYFSLPHSRAARMFYFFFQSRNRQNDPVVVWLTGGPGCGSEVALFYENGPFKFGDNLSLVWNDYGWDVASNIIFVDQPTGTGFSYTSDPSDDLRHDEVGVSTDLYDFLQAFFTQHPQFVSNDFYITGESYAGHYIPALASWINQANKRNPGIHINLKGIAIGNGLTNPSIQYPAYIDFALNTGLINQVEYAALSLLIPPCEVGIQACAVQGGNSCTVSLLVCQSILQKILFIAGNVNYYDIRKQCVGQMCYDFSGVETFLNMQQVRNALGVGSLQFVSCSRTVYEAMLQDWLRNMAVDIPALLEDGIKVLVYAGEDDLICNWLGNSRWVGAMQWSGQQQFLAAPTAQFMVDGAQAGLYKNHGPLTFLKVNGAGHMVPMDQPIAALQMLIRWMQRGTLG